MWLGFVCPVSDAASGRAVEGDDSRALLIAPLGHREGPAVGQGQPVLEVLGNGV